jgi:hypothetical protein
MPVGGDVLLMLSGVDATGCTGKELARKEFVWLLFSTRLCAMVQHVAQLSHTTSSCHTLKQSRICCPSIWANRLLDSSLAGLLGEGELFSVTVGGGF